MGDEKEHAGCTEQRKIFHDPAKLEAENARLREVNKKLVEALECLFLSYEHWTSTYKGEGIDLIRKQAREALALAEKEVK